MSCCGQKISGYTRAIQAIMDKAMVLEDEGREEEAAQLFESLAEHFESVQAKKNKKKSGRQ